MMSDSKSGKPEKEDISSSKPFSEIDAESETPKGPMSFLLGSLTSLLMAGVCLKLSQNIVSYFTLHPPNYNSPIAQSAASGFKTLVIGTSFLATFSFAFIGLGLILVFIRSLFDGKAPNAS